MRFLKGNALFIQEAVHVNITKQMVVVQEEYESLELEMDVSNY